jgi:excisionase family DNA binding protein
MWARMRNTIRAKIARNSDTYSSFLSGWSFDEDITTIPYFITYAAWPPERWGRPKDGLEDRIGTMPIRDFYTLAEAARVLEVPQRRLLEMLETGEIEGEQDPQSSRWRISKQAVHGLLAAGPSPEDPAEGPPERSAEMIQQLLEDVGNLHREVGSVRNRLNLARRAEKEERELLLAELEQERERHHQERERAEKLEEEANRLREELESERNKGSWRRLLGG